MDYVSVDQARSMPGLRLVLTAGQPGPWGEAAKALFRIRGVAFTPVRQDAAVENPELKAWTGLRNAPIAVYGDEQPRGHWMDIVDLAERLGSGPSLIPEALAQRVAMFGWIRELAGERGFAWYRRIQMFQPMMADAKLRARFKLMADQYGYSDTEAGVASERCVEVLGGLSELLVNQHASGNQYLMGDRLSALDIYWATFSNMIKPLPPEQAPMPEPTRQANTCQDTKVIEAVHPLLFQLRDHVWQDIIGLPMDF